MAKYRKISPKIWNDAKFRSLSDSAKLVFFMLLTHPQTSAIGTLRAFTQGLAAEMGWEHKAFLKAFGEVLAKGMVKVDERCGLVWMPNFMKHNVPESPNVLRSWRGALDDCPECQLKTEAFQAIKAFSQGMSEGFQKAFKEAFRLPMPNQEQEQEQEQDNISNTSCCRPPQSGEPHDEQSGGGQDVEIEDLCPPCPQLRIVELYHQILPTQPRMKSWRGARVTNLRSRWREAWDDGKFSTAEEGVQYWERLFRYIHDRCGFLTGKKPGRDGRPFLPSLEWIVKASSFSKIIEGNYDDNKYGGDQQWTQQTLEQTMMLATG